MYIIITYLRSYLYVDIFRIFFLFLSACKSEARSYEAKETNFI